MQSKKIQKIVAPAERLDSKKEKEASCLNKLREIKKNEGVYWIWFLNLKSIGFGAGRNERNLFLGTLALSL